MSKDVKLMLGDNISSLKKLPDNSIDSIVSDPPYGLSFMNKKWDYDVPSVEFWKEVYRVLKPGGHVLSFGGTRTYHRMVVNMEDAGFEIRDQIMWLYGSGFPKSHNIGKAVDKLQGNDREVIGIQTNLAGRNDTIIGDRTDSGAGMFSGTKKELEITKGQSEFEGWGTALKPANEPICLARKPLSEKSVAENVLKWKTGGINVDGCRVGTTDKLQKLHHQEGANRVLFDMDRRENGKKIEFVDAGEGRFPANIILECCCDEVIKGEKGEVKKTTRDRKYDTGDSRWDGLTSKQEGIDNYNDKGDIHTNPNCPCYVMDSQSGISKPSKGRTGIKGGSPIHQSTLSVEVEGKWPADNGGGASRFFYQAKVSKKERNMGLDDLKNSHPTLKPVQLMTYLCRLVTPEGGIILDPFMGSGSTGIAARLEGFRFVGMEMDEDYFKISSSRIDNYEKYREFLKK